MHPGPDLRVWAGAARRRDRTSAPARRRLAATSGDPVQPNDTDERADKRAECALQVLVIGDASKVCESLASVGYPLIELDIDGNPLPQG